MKKIFLLTVVLSIINCQLSTIVAQTFTVMSYNCASINDEQNDENNWEHRKAAVVKMLLAEQPDVVGVQEDLPDQEAYMREKLSPLYDAVAIRRDPENSENEACTIFYRADKFDMVHTNTFRLNETPEVPSQDKNTCIVSYVYVREKESGQDYLVFNTHLDKHDAVSREKCLAMIADSAKSIGGDIVPMFMLGDLNVTPDAPELAPMWKTMKLAQREAPVTDSLYTFHGYNSGKSKTIDYIFYSNASALEFRIVRDGYGVPYLSDHYPIAATFSKAEISAEVYNTVVAHNAIVRKRINRTRDNIKFGYYKQSNDGVHKGRYKANVILYGNSITRNWPKRHPTFFRVTGYTCRGISGQTSSDLLVRMRPDVIDLKPKVVVIMCGVNDIAQNGGKISLENVLGNIISMCELAKVNKIKPVLCSVLPARSFYWNPFVYDAPEKIRQLNTMIESYAKKNSIPYVDYYSAMVDEDGGLKPGLSEDEVHPISAGYDIMESILQQTLKKLK